MTNKICTLLFLRKENQILLAMKKRGWGDKRFNGIGGKVEKNETIAQALVRECKEEIKVTPLKYEKVAQHDFIYKNEDNSLWHMYVHVYFCEQWQGEPQETEEMKPEWFELKDIPYEQMWEDDKFWLPLVLKGQKIIGVFTFGEENRLLTHKVKEVKVLADG
jgi:mutator protein MutT